MADSTRDGPRISVNALTKYLGANPAQRRRIVSEQKQPREFQVIYYKPASDTIRAFLIDEDRDEDLLVSEIDRLYTLNPKNDYEKHRWTNNAEALGSFLEFHEDVDTLDLGVSNTSTQYPKLHLSGVDVSVFPELLLQGTHTRYGETVGGINLFFTKDAKLRLTDTTGRYPSCLVYRLLTESIADRHVLPRACITLDVFGQTVHAAPKAHKRLMGEIEAACQEFAMWWDRID